MTDENDKKKYEHLKGLIAGKLKTGNPIRDDLIVSDAKLNLADLIKKRPLVLEGVKEEKVEPKIKKATVMKSEDK